MTMLQPRQWIILAFIVAVLLMGGASAAGLAANIVLQIAAAILLSLTLWQYRPGANLVTGLAPFLAALAGLAALQFLPLPPALWSLFPGREAIAKGYELAGIERPWIGLTLDRWKSLHSLIWWLPAVAILAAMRSPESPPSRAVVHGIAAVAYASVLLAAAQVLSLSGYLYTVTNVGNGVGLFANSNHFGTFMLISAALVAGQYIQDRAQARRRAGGLPQWAALGLLVSPMLLGIYLSESLACALLALPLLGGIAIMARPELQVPRVLVVLATAIVAAIMMWLLASGYLTNDLLARTGTPGISRSEFAANTLTMIGKFAPFGTGLGTFSAVYPWFETTSKVGGTFANHAHNDLLELISETGIAGLLLLGLFLRWLWVSLNQAWSGSRSGKSVAQAATLAIGLTLLHSLVDYPLRTAAISSLIAVCCVFSRRAATQHITTKVSEGAGPREVMLRI